MERSNAAEWAKRVERWKDSGLTAKEFAAQWGLKASMLGYWQWKLRRGEQSGERKRRPATGISRPAPRTLPMQFVELPAAVVGSSASGLELVLDGGIRVRVPTGFDEATLTCVLRAVEASR